MYMYIYIYIYIKNKEVRLPLFLSVMKRVFTKKEYEIKKGVIDFKVTAIGKKIRIEQPEVKTY